MKLNKGILAVTALAALVLSSQQALATDMSQSKSAYSSQKAKEYFENKIAYTTGPVEVSHMLGKDSNVQIVDVRYPEDYVKGHVPGAINLPPESWGKAASKLNKDKVTILYCYTQVCHLAAEAAVKLASQGYQVKEMEGGYKAWVDNKLQVEHTS